MEVKKMRRYTQKMLREMVREGVAVDVTRAGDLRGIPEPFTKIGYSAGVYGCNGLLLMGDKSGRWYAVTARTPAVWIFG